MPLAAFVVGGFGSATVTAFFVGRSTVTITDVHALRDLAIRHRDELKEELSEERRLVGDSLLAIRQKVNDVELEMAKTYMRRESWHMAMNQLQERLGSDDKAMEQRLMRLETKLDGIAERLPRAPA